MDVPEKRKLLCEWLEERVNSGHYLGLNWLDKDKRIFCIPWYHNNNVTDTDKPAIFKVFVDYASFSNKYREGTKPNYSDFKHNFRCALKKLKSDFERLQDNSKNKNDPHMVYRFVKPISLPHSKSPPDFAVTWNYLASNENACHGPNIPEVVGLHNVTRECGDDLNFSPQTNYQTNIGSMPNEIPFATTAPGGESSAFPECNIAELQSFGTPGFTNLSLFQVNGDVHYDAGNVNMTEEDQTPSDLKAVDLTDLIPLQEPQNLPMSVSSSLNTPENSLTLSAAARVNDVAAAAQCKGYKMIVKVFYGRSKIQVMHEYVGKNGCRIHFGHRLQSHKEEDRMYGPKDITDLTLPIVGDNIEISKREKILMSQILDKMSRGVALTYRDGDIYAQRLSKSRIYLCDVRFQSRCLKKTLEVPVKVFDFQNFKSSCEAWCSSPARDLSQRPVDHFCLAIGIDMKQDLVPDINSECMRNVLLCVRVSHVAAREILDQINVVAQDVDSLEKMQESLPDSMDNLEAMIKGMLNIANPNSLNRCN